MKFLIIGDEQKNRRLMAFGLADDQTELTSVSSPDDIGRLFSPTDYHAAVLDWEMRSHSASRILGVLRQVAPSLPVVVTTATAHGAVDARKEGAAEAVLKPLEIDGLRAKLQRYAARVADVTPVHVKAEPAAAAESVQPDYNSQNPVMQRMLDVAWRVAPTDATVLILGENGTGKTALAAEMHRRSSRTAMPFVTVNCPCLQPQLLESELFGHVKGSFTGAVCDTMGKVAAAEGGTLFLDEIGELPLEIQPKLLRLLHDREYERLGEHKPRKASIRVVAATNRDLKAEVKAGRFREDLYYRLNVITIEVLPLRQRPEDVAVCAENFLRGVAKSLKRPFRGFTLPAREALESYSWPGNLRELRNAVERAAILCEGDLLDVNDFADLIERTDGPTPQVGDFVSLATLVEEHIRQVVERAGSLEHAARVLGIDRSTLYRRRKRTEARVADYHGAVAQAQPA